MQRLKIRIVKPYSISALLAYSQGQCQIALCSPLKITQTSGFFHIFRNGSDGRYTHRYHQKNYNNYSFHHSLLSQSNPIPQAYPPYSPHHQAIALRSYSRRICASAITSTRSLCHVLFNTFANFENTAKSAFLKQIWPQNLAYKRSRSARIWRKPCFFRRSEFWRRYCYLSLF